MFHAATKIAYTAWHYINQDKIAMLYCINKDKAELNCKGCCHLVTKLNQMDVNKKTGDTFPAPVADTQIDWYLEKNASDLQVFCKSILKINNEFAAQIVNSEISKPHPPPEV